MARLGELRTRLPPWSTDAKWALPLAAYRLSGGRVGDVPQLYRASIPWRRFAYQALPGMTTLTERAYFYWQTRELYTGAGAIVDLGSWFGSTTATLAMGLEANRRRAARHALIHAYDSFAWDAWMDDYASAARHGPYAVGDSFEREFEHVVHRWRRRIEVHAADLTAATWAGEPVEVLLIDAMKSWDLATAICRGFVAPLMPGAYLIHQDFGHCFTPWIHLVMYRLRERLVPFRDVLRSETMVFRTVAPVAETDLADLGRSSFAEDEVEAAFAHSQRITSSAKHSGILASRVILLLDDGDPEAARALLARLRARGQLSQMHAAAMDAACERAEQSHRRDC